MGFLDELKDKAEESGDEAKEGFEAAKDKTKDVIENVKDRFDSDETPAENAGQGDAAAAASDTGQDVGEFAPVGATNPEVAASKTPPPVQRSSPPQPWEASPVLRPQKTPIRTSE